MTTEYGFTPEGMSVLKQGQVVDWGMGPHVVRRLSESNATVQPLHKVEVMIRDGVHHKVVTVRRSIPPFQISRTLEDRHIKAANEHEFAKSASPGDCAPTSTTGEEESENNMAKKAKTKKAKTTTESTEGKSAKSGRLGSIMGHSTCSVLKRLGMAGVTVPHAQAIMAKQGIKASETTVKLNIAAGVRGDAKAAPLTKEQVEELKACAKAPEPKKAEESKK